MEQLRRRTALRSKTRQIHLRVASRLLNRFIEVAAATGQSPTDALRAAMESHVDQYCSEGCRITGELEISLGGQKLLLRLFLKDDELAIRVTGAQVHRITQRLFPGVAPKRDSGKEPVERSRAAADRSMEIDPPGRAPAKLAEMTFCEGKEAHRSDPTRRKLGHQVIPASDGGESPRRRAMGSW